VTKSKPGRNGPGTPKDGAATSGDVASGLPWATREEYLEHTLNDLAEKLKAGNLLAGLYAVTFANDHDLELPRNVLAWLAHGCALYLGDRLDSLDAALELNARGAKNPKARRSKIVKRAQLLNSMFELQVRAGASVPEAAVLVSRLSADYKVTTLVTVYKQLGYEKTAAALSDATRVDPTAALARFPDTEPADEYRGEVAKAKAAIQSRYFEWRGSKGLSR
jgi:hypothetical protein